MERWRQAEIEALESVDHMLGALDIAHKLINHDWVEVNGYSVYTVEELRRIDSDVLWDRVLGMVIRSMGPVVTV